MHLKIVFIFHRGKFFFFFKSKRILEMYNNWEFGTIGNLRIFKEKYELDVTFCERFLAQKKCCWTLQLKLFEFSLDLTNFFFFISGEFQFIPFVRVYKHKVQNFILIFNVLGVVKITYCTFKKTNDEWPFLLCMCRFYICICRVIGHI